MSSSSSRRDQGTTGGGPPVKVRVIVTKFVEVDAREFKSAVQYLTGKDSVVAEAEDRGRGRKRPLEFVSGHEQVLQREEEEGGVELILPDELFEFLRD